MTNRFNDAILVQAGACNPHGITRSLLRALDACRDEGLDTNAVCADPAIRLIAHQLAFILGVGELDRDPSVYSAMLTACEDRQAVNERERERLALEGGV